MKFNFNKQMPESKIIPDLWKKNEKSILENIKLITGLSLNTKEITCSLDASTTNGFYGDKSITLGIKGGISNDDALMVISHELFHIYYWRKLKELGVTKSSPGKETKKEWELAEASAFLLMNESVLMKHWPTAEVFLIPDIEKTYNQVKGFWKVGDIESFMIKAYNEIK